MVRYYSGDHVHIRWSGQVFLFARQRILGGFTIDTLPKLLALKGPEPRKRSGALGKMF